jgi:hypothetical protein
MSEYLIWLWFIPAIIIHELGHYLAYRYFGFKPSIKFKWYGILLGENVFHKAKPYQAYLITITGILAGLPFVVHDDSLLVVYLFICMIDFVIILNILSIPKEFKDKPLIDYYEYNIKKLRVDEE